MNSNFPPKVILAVSQILPSNSGKFIDNCWISCQVMADMKKVYDNLILLTCNKLFSVVIW